MPFYLLVVVFVGFTAAALQYSVLGSVWPLVYEDFGAALSFVGYINMILALGRVTASLSTDSLVRRIGTFKVAAIGFGCIVLALFGYANSHSFVMLCISSIPLGLGEDLFLTAMNAFAAVNLKTSHANWLNMVWSLGATLGPYIMSFCLGKGFSWNSGYLVLTLIQVCVLLLFLSSGSQWKKITPVSASAEKKDAKPREKVYKLKYMPVMMIAFLLMQQLRTHRLCGAAAI